MSGLQSKIGATLLKSALRGALQSSDTSRYGGTPTLGLRGLAIKMHNNAKAAGVCSAALRYETFERQHILWSIAEAVSVRGG